MHKLQELLFHNKALFLALDHGLEHGPKDFNIQTIDPEYVLNLALHGKYNAIVLQKGLAEKYYENFRYKVPLILKLNGKTNLPQNVLPYSPQNCSVSRAVKLGASAIGYTIYFGSPYETQMLKEFSKIQEEARDHNMPVVVWSYPRGPGINDLDTDVVAYGARASMELGADIIKLKYNRNLEGFKWIVKCAGKARVVLSGGPKVSTQEFLKDVNDIISVGAVGVAVGRNVWQHNKPLEMSKALNEIIFERKSVDYVMRKYKL